MHSLFLRLCSITLALSTSSLAVAAEPDVPANSGGTTVFGESCIIEPLKTMVDDFGAPLQLACEGNVEGMIIQARAPGMVIGNDDPENRSKIERRIATSAPFRALQLQMTCKPAVWIEKLSAVDAQLVAFSCAALDGDWPHLVLASIAADRLVIADSSPAALPALLLALQSSRAQEPVAAHTALIEKIWDGPLELLRSGDIAKHDRLQKAGRMANGAGQYAKAEAAFRGSLDLETGTLKANDITVATTLLNLALNVSNQGKVDEADGLFRRAIPLLQASSDDRLRARLATYLTLNAANALDYKKGLPLSRDASTAWRILAEERRNQMTNAESEQAPPATAELGELANALNIQALMELRSENLVLAYGAASEALQILNKSDKFPRWWKADSMIVLGEISIAQGRLSAAETYFNSAISLRRSLYGDTAPTIRAMAALARSYQTEAMNSSAIITYREIFKMAKALPSTQGIFNAERLIPFGNAVVEMAESVTEPEERRGLFAEAFDAFQLVQSPLVDKTIAQAAARLSSADPEIEKLISDVQDHQREHDGARVKLSYQQSLPDNERSGNLELALKTQIANSTRSMTSGRAKLLEKYPDYNELVAPKKLDLDTFRATLRSKEGVLSFLIGHDRSFAQLVTREGATISAISLGDLALREEVESLRSALEIQAGTVKEYDLDRASDLYELLLGGLKTELADVERLVVIPAGPLSNLPFGVLVASAPDGAGYKDADWLIRSKTLSYAPSLKAFNSLRMAQPRVAPQRSLLAFGDPALKGPSKSKGEVKAMAALANSCRRGGAMPAGLLTALAPLPDTASELNSVALALGANKDNLYLGTRATEENFRDQTLEDYRVIYFATHGLLPGELRCQGEPGLVLSPPAATATDAQFDGLLESSEIASLRLNADLVVLSACNTAAGDGQQGGGDALSGLAEAFFHAGARNMLVTHWQVPSAATTMLMSGLFETLSVESDEGVNDALRQSQLQLITDDKTSHPFFWGAFVLIGDGQSSPLSGATEAESKSIATR